MQYDINDAVNLLGRTPAVLRAMLEGLPEEWLRCTDGLDTWSPFDVLGHLIHGERSDWIARARMILEEGPGRTFTPFDRFAQFRESTGRSVRELLDEFSELRSGNIRALQAMNLTPGDLDRQGTHPAFGPVTLRQLLATWAAHDQSHLVQIARTMARQYREEVGPWRAYLSVMG
ncbi:MAG TPA: DinB family protein [Candidatus Kapabacteria bacterium]|nr:DinB family protein [Candidatus Kapabacteria bacterium]